MKLNRAIIFLFFTFGVSLVQAMNCPNSHHEKGYIKFIGKVSGGYYYNDNYVAIAHYQNGSTRVNNATGVGFCWSYVSKPNTAEQRNVMLESIWLHRKGDTDISKKAIVFVDVNPNDGTGAIRSLTCHNHCFISKYETKATDCQPAKKVCKVAFQFK